jgi:hypothetical protein
MKLPVSALMIVSVVSALLGFNEDGIDFAAEYESKSLQPTDLFKDCDVQIKIHVPRDNSEFKPLRLRQSGSSKFRLDVDNKVFVINGDFAFIAAKSPSAHLVKWGYGYDNPVFKEVRKQLFSKSRFMDLPVNGGLFPGNLQQLLSDDGIYVSEISEGDQIAWHLDGEFPIQQEAFSKVRSGMHMKLLPNEHFLLSAIELYCGSADALNEVTIGDFMQRDTKSLAKNEKIVIRSIQIAYKHLSGRRIPYQIVGDSSPGTVTEIVNISPLEQEDGLVFSPESIGLETPSRPIPTWFKWVALSAVSFAAGSYFIYQYRSKAA